MPMDAPPERSSGSVRPSTRSDRHVPVLLDRVLDAARSRPRRPAGRGRRRDPRPRRTRRGAARRPIPQLTLVGLDRDPAALARSRERLVRFQTRLHLVHAVYDRMADVLADLGHPLVDGVLFDLGVSSMQLDVAERGFSYASDAALDMRMDQGRGQSAEDIVNEYPVAELARVLREYGEERFALRIAQAIVRARAQEPLTSTARLAELVRDAIPAATRRTGGHPAKRTFQALRIEVNGELDALRAALPAALSALRGPWADRRAVLPLARGPHRQAAARRSSLGTARRSTCRWSSPTADRSCGCSPGAERPERGGSRRQPPVGVSAAAGGRADSSSLVTRIARVEPVSVSWTKPTLSAAAQRAWAARRGAAGRSTAGAVHRAHLRAARRWPVRSGRAEHRVGRGRAAPSRRHGGQRRPG